MLQEGYHEFISIDNEDEAFNLVVKCLLRGFENNEFEPDDWILIEDDGILIGKYQNFDSDSIYNADKIDTLIDLNNGEIINQDRIRERVSSLFS